MGHPTRNPIRIVLCLVLAAGCASRTEVSPKPSVFAPPTFSGADGQAALVTEAPTLCQTGTVTMQFAAPEQAFGYVFRLSAGDSGRLETRGAEDLDTTIALYGPRDPTGFYGAQAVAWDDDSGSGLLSLLPAFVATAPGDYLAIVSTYGGKGRGTATLAVSVNGQAGCAIQPPPRLDILYVLDDSSSMARERARVADGIGFVLDTLGRIEGIDLRIAVTTTNVCPADEGGNRGKFVYHPATLADASPSAIARRTMLCETDADCAAWEQANPLSYPESAPSPDQWVCDARTPGPAWTCDAPSAPDAVLVALTSSCRFRCDASAGFPDCAEGQAYCLTPGGDAGNAGCVEIPRTDGCSPDGPTVLDDSVAAQWAQRYRDGTWAGKADWAGMNDADLRRAVFVRLFECLVEIPEVPSVCGTQEQGLLAAWMALDTTGENAAQAQAFLREDAFLLVRVVSDEDDCSTDAPLSNKEFGRCSCLSDTAGCGPDGTCDAAAPGPLLPVADMVAKLQSLKPEPSRVMLAVRAGDVVPGSATTPGDDADAARDRYLACKCAGESTSLMTYACIADLFGGIDYGKADLGRRYLEATKLLNGPGAWFENLCRNEGGSTDWAVVDRLRAAGFAYHDPACDRAPEPHAANLSWQCEGTTGCALPAKQVDPCEFPATCTLCKDGVCIGEAMIDLCIPEAEPTPDVPAETSSSECAELPALWASVLADPAVRACTRDDECILIGGTGSCECTPSLGNGGGTAIAVNALAPAWSLQARFWSQDCAAWRNTLPTECDTAPSKHLRCDAGTCVADNASCLEGPWCKACQPACGGRVCGDDGCGGTCGLCPAGQACFGGACVPADIPDCRKRECGDDGFGGSCGACPDGWTCEAAGTCGPPGGCAGLPAGGLCVNGGPVTCVDGQIHHAPICALRNCEAQGGVPACAPAPCIADCFGRTCGSDGCGGSCGVCGAGRHCDETTGACLPDSGCGDVPTWGRCEGHTRLACVDGQVVAERCLAFGTVCNACSDPICGALPLQQDCTGLPAGGHCEGDHLFQCVAGLLVSTSCSGSMQGLTCKRTSVDGYGCL